MVGIVGAIGCNPVEDRYLVDRHLVGTIEGAAVGEGTSERSKASLDGVFPYGIFVGIEVFVDNDVGLFNFGMGGGCP